MKKGTFASLLLLLAGIAWAQNESPGQVISQPATATNVTQAALGSLSFTNQAGTVYSTEQLSSQLQELRNNIEQTLPMLMAYTETVSNVAASGNRSLGGTVTEILSDVLNRRGNQQKNSSGNFFSSSNVLGVLQGLLVPGKDTNTVNPINVTALKDLTDVQTELKSVNTKLQRLSVPGTNTVVPLTPTGR